MHHYGEFKKESFPSKLEQFYMFYMQVFFININIIIFFK